MRKRQVGKSRVEGLGRGLPAPGPTRSGCTMLLLKLLGVEPKPRTMGKSKEGGGLVAQLSPGPSLKGGPIRAKEVPGHWRGWGKDGKCSRMGNTCPNPSSPPPPPPSLGHKPPC